MLFRNVPPVSVGRLNGAGPDIPIKLPSGWSGDVRRRGSAGLERKHFQRPNETNRASHTSSAEYAIRPEQLQGRRSDDGIPRSSSVTRLASGASRLGAATLLIFALVTAYLGLDWSWNGDWKGYYQIYVGAGAWLADRGRDPLFVFIINRAAALFGGEGYEIFRHIAFAPFVLAAAWLAATSPRQLIRPSIIPIVACIITVMSVKSLVQIREGLGFILVIIASRSIATKARNKVLIITLLALASMMHAGLAIFLFSYLFGISFPKIITINNSYILSGLLFILGMGFGALLILAPSAAAAITREIGTSSDTSIQNNYIKYIYWAMQGLSVFFLSIRLKSSTIGLKYDQSRVFILYIAIWLLPFLYGICFIMSASGAPVALLASAAIRLLFTTMELSLIIILWRGGMGGITLGVCAFMMIDRGRLLILSLAG
jgi:hypothetical protein